MKVLTVKILLLTRVLTEPTKPSVIQKNPITVMDLNLNRVFTHVMKRNCRVVI